MSQPAWVTAGRGLRPRSRWSFSTEAPLVAVELARETGETLAVDDAGGLYRLDRAGNVLTVSRGFHHLSALAWSDVGEGGAAVFADEEIAYFDDHLKVQWSAEMPEVVRAVAVDPRGNYVAAALANADTVIYDRNRTLVGRFSTPRPLAFVRFLATRPQLVGAAEYGLLCCRSLDGAEVWTEKLFSSTGDMALSGDGEAVYLAGFNIGVQTHYAADGTRAGGFALEGTPNHISTTFSPFRLAITTIERHLYWLDDDGDLVWCAVLPDDCCGVRCEPLGHGLVCGFRKGRIERLNWAGRGALMADV